MGGPGGSSDVTDLQPASLDYAVVHESKIGSQ